jgi:hypothetical protein
MMDPGKQSEWATLQAELRSAVQHQRAAYARLIETQREVQNLMDRARRLLAPADAAAATDATQRSDQKERTLSVEPGGPSVPREPRNV